MTPRLSLPELLYFALMSRRRARFLARARGEEVPVVSVGNLSLGGTGKTPCVRWLARRALEDDLRPAIASRGYGGRLSGAGALASDGRQVLLAARDAGDEPIEHARALPGVPVAVGRDRHRAVKLALEAGADVVILDDGFGFWSLERACDLILLDARRPFGNGHLLPRGRLREEPDALSRAHAVLLTRAERASPAELERAQVLVARFTRAPMWISRHAPRAVVDQDGREWPLEVLARAPVAALSALADNAAFACSLQNLGAQVLAHTARRDHHAWTRREVQGAADSARRLGARAIVTTGKDAAKIDPAWLGGLPLWTLRIELEIERGDELWRHVRGLITPR